MKLQRRKSAQRWFHLFIWLAAGLLALAVLGGGTLAAADAGDTLTPAASPSPASRARWSRAR